MHLSPKRALYDQLLGNVLDKVKLKSDASNLQEYKTALANEFSAFPDNYRDIHRQGLAYFTYQKTSGAALAIDDDVEELLDDGHIAINPITYEDFLPVSAAGIFRSNLTDDKAEHYTANAAQTQFEAALGRSLIDPFTLYQAIADESWNALF